LLERIEAAIRFDAILSAPCAIGLRANARREQTGECDCSDRNWAHCVPSQLLSATPINAFAKGIFQPPARPGVDYMLSTENRVPNQEGVVPIRRT
jgi:hypothetical protein